MNLYELRQLLLNQLPEEPKSDRESDRETGLVLLRMSEVLLQELKEHTGAFQESGGRELRRVLLRCGNMARTLREIGEQCGSSLPKESARAAQILQERTDLFTNLEQSIQAKEETLKRVSLASAALAQRAAQLAQEESNLMMAEADLQARQKEIREQEARIAELERKMTENSQPKLAEARQRAESLAAALSRQQEELQTLETANAGMEAACAETEKRLAEAQAEQVSLKSRSARGEKELEKTEQRNQRIAAGAEENLCIVCGGQIPEGAETCPACAFPTELPVLLSRRQHEQWLRTVVEPACRAWQKQKAAEEARLRQEEEERQRKAAEEEARRQRKRRKRLPKRRG